MHRYIVQATGFFIKIGGNIMNIVSISVVVAMLVMVVATMYVLCQASDTQEERLREYCENCHEKCEDCPIGYRLSGKR